MVMWKCTVEGTQINQHRGQAVGGSAGRNRGVSGHEGAGGTGDGSGGS